MRFLHMDIIFYYMYEYSLEVNFDKDAFAMPHRSVLLCDRADSTLRIYFCHSSVLSSLFRFHFFFFSLSRSNLGIHL